MPEMAERADNGVCEAAGPMPSPVQLALAMAIVKQKPAAQDIKEKEYIFQLRSFITEAKEPHPVNSDKFFDSVRFWQQAYENSEAEQSKLLDRIYELEQRNIALASREQNAGQDEKITESSKRKANPNVGADKKRAKTQAPKQNAASKSTSVQGGIDILDIVEYKEESTGRFMRHFYTLQKTLQRRPSRSGIVQAAVNLAVVATDSLLDAVREKKTTTNRASAMIILQHKDPEIRSVVRSVGSATELLYQALAKLCNAGQSGTEIGKVSYHIVCLYEATMRALEQYCKVRAEQITAPAKSTAKSTAKSKRRQSAKSKRPELNPDDNIAGQITRLLGSITLSLDLIYPEHQELMQGALYFLLNRVGKLLCLFVFRDLQLHPDLRVDSSKLPLPQGLTEVNLSEKALCAAKLEAKHLIWVLERILAYLNTVPPSSTTQMFTAKIKEGLQSSLLQAVFGAEDGSFQKSLELPFALDNELGKLHEYTKIPEQEVPDWFIQEVWRLLGWDMLMNEQED